MKKSIKKGLAVLTAAICCTVMMPKTANAALMPGVHLHAWEEVFRKYQYSFAYWHDFLEEWYYDENGRWVEVYVECEVYHCDRIYDKTCTICGISNAEAVAEEVGLVHTEWGHPNHPKDSEDSDDLGVPDDSGDFG